MRASNRQSGMSLVEVLMATGIAGVLGMGAFGTMRLEGPGLTVANQEIQGSLDQAYMLARNSGQAVTVSASAQTGIGHLPVKLPGTVHWGLPANVPLPPKMDPTTRAASEGEAHPTITITPRHTATATVWFLNDGHDALCVRVNGHAHATTLRWHADRHRWDKI